MRNRWHASRSRVRPPAKYSRVNHSIGSNDGRNLATTLCGLGFVVFTLLSSGGCGSKNVSAAAAPPPNVQIVEVIQRDVPVLSRISRDSGWLRERANPAAGFRLPRQTELRGRRGGAEPSAFKIDPRPLQAIVDQAKAQVAQAEAQRKDAAGRATRHSLAKGKAIAQSQLDNDIQLILPLKRRPGRQSFTGTGRTESGVHQCSFAGRRCCRNRRRPGGNLVGPQIVLTTVSQVEPVKAYFTVSEQEYLAFVKRNPTEADRAARERQLDLD